MLNRISPTGTFEASETDHRFDLREVLSFVWRQWKFIAAVMGVVFLIGLVSLMRQTPLYTATSLVLLDRQREKAPGVEAILTDVNLDFAMVESQMAIIRSSVFLRRVVDKERLVSDPEFGTRRGPPSPGFFASLRGLFSGGSAAEEAAPKPPEEPDEQPMPRDVLHSVEALKGAVSVARNGQGHVLAISVVSRDPARVRVRIRQ